MCIRMFIAWLDFSKREITLRIELVCLAVPIIPSYLYALQHQSPAENPVASPEVISATRFQKIYSYYDNLTMETGKDGERGGNEINATQPAVVNSTTAPGSNSSCLKHKDLLNENVEVGLLFASKATVQLVTNPFIGPLTNRWANAHWVLQWSFKNPTDISEYPFEKTNLNYLKGWIGNCYWSLNSHRTW